MSDFSPEPQRRECVLHYTFNFVGNNSAIDLSPQSNNGVVSSGVGQSDTGTIGQSAHFDGNANAFVESPTVIGGENAASFSTWVNFGRLSTDRAIAGNSVHQTWYDVTQDAIAVAVTDFQGNTVGPIYTNTSPSENTWYHVTWTYSADGFLKLYLDTVSEASVRTNGFAVDSATDLFVGKDTVHNTLAGNLDDTRYYRKVLSEEEINGLFEIGDEHNSVDEIRDVWATDGIPFRGTNTQLAGALGEQKDAVSRQLDAIKESRQINYASGEQLDRIGLLNGIKRKENEADDRYRARIIGILAAGRSSGTFSDILNITAAILETTIDRIRLEEAWEKDANNTATVDIFIDAPVVNNSVLTTTDINNILADIVIAGHAIEAFKSGTFTVINDSQVSDADQGLTSDTISTGGTLTSDI